MFLNYFLKDLATKPCCEVFYKEKKSQTVGKTKLRRCVKQNASMRCLQLRMKDYAEQFLQHATHITGFVAGKNAIDHVTPHLNRRYWYTSDISNAFPSVDVTRLATLLWNLDFRFRSGENSLQSFLDLRTFLCDYICDTSGGLMMGTSSSPTLFNLYAYETIDLPLLLYCLKHDIRYTRYGDDLLFSAHKPIGKHKRKAIRQIIQRGGFTLDCRKTGVYDRQKGSITLVGIGIKPNGVLYTPRAYLRRIKGAIFLARKGELKAAKIHGMMSVYKQLTRNRKPTKTEKTVLQQYKRMKRCE